MEKYYSAKQDTTNACDTSYINYQPYYYPTITTQTYPYSDDTYKKAFHIAKALIEKKWVKTESAGKFIVLVEDLVSEL